MVFLNVSAICGYIAIIALSAKAIRNFVRYMRTGC